MKFTLLTLLLFLSSLAIGQIGSISGTVYDTNDRAMGFVNVLVEDVSVGTVTDNNGNFNLSNIPAGSQTLRFSLVGYKEQTLVLEVKPNQINTVTIKLQEGLEELQVVEIIGRREDSYKSSSSFVGTKSSTLLKDVPQSISYVTKELILDQAAFRVNDVVKNISGVNQFSFYNDITIRGNRIQGQANSGHLINGMPAFTSFWKQQLIPHIERVEVIKGPA